MIRPAKWISSAIVGLVLGWEGLPAQSQILADPAQPTPALRSQANDPQESLSATSPRAGGNATAADGEPSEGNADVSPSMGKDEPGEIAPHDRGETEVITERYPDGAVKIEREVTQDDQFNYINHGAWEMWDPHGNPIAQGEYDNNYRTGTWIRWYRNPAEASLLTTPPYRQFTPPFISQATFNSGRLDGTWTIYDGKKRKISEWEFVDGKRHGTGSWWYANGRKMREIQYRDGEADGELVEWNHEGAVLVKETYQGGRKLARKTVNQPGGKKQMEGMYLFAKDVEQSPDDWWNCKPRANIKQGKDERHGPLTSWYANGQVRTEGTFDHDLQSGQFTWWHGNGQKALEGRFESGKQVGGWTWWYASGQKSTRGEYALGNPTGRWVFWNPDGRLAQSADLSHSEGIVIDTPATPDPDKQPRAAAQPSRSLPRR